MKVKLTNNEMITLLAIVDMNIKEYECVEQTDFEAKLYRCIFEELRVRLFQIIIIKKSHYSLKMKPHWALAFYNDFKNNEDNVSYAGNLINRLCLQIHQQFLTI